MINPQKLHQELLVANLPVDGVHEDGIVDWTRELTESEKGAVKNVLDAHDPTEIPQITLENRVDVLEIAVIDLALGGGNV